MRFLVLLLFIGIVGIVNAQHCPFDGYYVVTVHLNKPLPNDYQLFLEQIPTADTDTCKYGQELTYKAFMRDRSEAFVNNGEGSISRFNRGLDNDFDFTKDNYFIYIGDSQRNCIYEDPNTGDYTYFKKSFNVVLKKDKTILLTVPVSENNVYRLCTSSGRWSRIKPIELNW